MVQNCENLATRNIPKYGISEGIILRLCNSKLMKVEFVMIFYLFKIRVEMLKERSLALKEQEERLGALVAELQLSKAKEVSYLTYFYT